MTFLPECSAALARRLVIDHISEPRSSRLCASEQIDHVLLAHSRLSTLTPSNAGSLGLALDTNDFYVLFTFPAMKPVQRKNFVDRAGRRTAAVSCAASLKPLDQPEWLRAADVTMARFFAVYSLARRNREGISVKQRRKHNKDIVHHTRALRDARLRYDRMWNFRVA
jgi:glutathione S-transferase